MRLIRDGGKGGGHGGGGKGCGGDDDAVGLHVLGCRVEY